MKKNKTNKLSSENLIIKKYLKKLHFNKLGTFNFKNDAAYIKLKKNKKLVVTTDSISENIDFFRNDDPRSIATKLTTINLSDLSAMGVQPYTYSLNLFLPKYVDENWIKNFTSELFNIQKKYNFYLIGGDLSKSKLLSVSSTFFGYSKKNKIINQNSISINNDIWITGTLGNSYMGLQILKKKINVSNNLNKYFSDKYYYPKPFIYGHELGKYVKSMKDISDGFIADLSKMLDGRFGAKLNLNLIPLKSYLKRIQKKESLSISSFLNCGDDYELIIISSKKQREKILNFAKKNKVMITRVGKVTKNLGILDDSNNPINIPREFDHFS